MSYFAHGFISGHIAIHNSYCLLSKTEIIAKTYWGTNNIKMEKNELKKVSIKNSLPYYFDDSIKVEDFPFDNILLDKKSYKNILIYGVS